MLEAIPLIHATQGQASRLAIDSDVRHRSDLAVSLDSTIDVFIGSRSIVQYDSFFSLSLSLSLSLSEIQSSDG